MSVRPQIPGVEGVQDKQVVGILGPIKMILEQLTGRTPNRPQIKSLGANSSLSGVINKVNEVIARLQDADTATVPTAMASGTSPIVGSFTRDMTAASGSQAVTGIGFKPTALIFLSGVVGGSYGGSVGVADATSQFSLETFGSAPAEFLQPGTAGIVRTSVGGGDFQLFSVSAISADGFTATWTKSGAPSGTGTIVYLAIR